jgi:hypothetical protein
MKLLTRMKRVSFYQPERSITFAMAIASVIMIVILDKKMHRHSGWHYHLMACRRITQRLAIDAGRRAGVRHRRLKN